MLPVLSVFAVSKKSSAVLLLVMFGMLAFIYWFGIGINRWAQTHILSFVIGAACAHVSRFYKKLSFSLRTPIFSVVALASCLACILWFNQPYTHIPTLLIGIGFIIVSSGNGMFSLLTKKTIKLLGAISFSVYMLHGITYTIFFMPLIKSGFSYQLAIAITLPLIIMISIASYLAIERPFIMNGNVMAERGFGE